MKYLTLIRTLALLRQHQRPVKTVVHGGKTLEYIEAVASDIAVANRLCHQVLGRSLDDLPPQTRRLLMLVDGFVEKLAAEKALPRSDVRFMRREVRAATGWGDTQLKIHLGRLEDLEYLVVHRVPKGQGFAYELVYDGKGKDGTPFLAGLLDADGLGVDPPAAGEHAYDKVRSGVNAPRSAPGRGAVGPQSAGGRGGVTTENSSSSEDIDAAEPVNGESARLGPRGNGASYVTLSAAPAGAPR